MNQKAVTVTKSREIQTIPIPNPQREIARSLFSDVWDTFIDSGHDIQYMDTVLEELVGVVDFFQQYRDMMAFRNEPESIRA